MSVVQRKIGKQTFAVYVEVANELDALAARLAEALAFGVEVQKALEVDRDRLVDYETLKRAVNESTSECDPDCDDYGHSDKCPANDPARWLIDQQKQIESLNARLAEVERERDDAEANLESLQNRFERATQECCDLLSLLREHSGMDDREIYAAVAEIVATRMRTGDSAGECRCIELGYTCDVCGAASEYRCVEHPRLTRIVQRPNRDAEIVESYRVAGIEAQYYHTLAEAYAAMRANPCS